MIYRRGHLVTIIAILAITLSAIISGCGGNKKVLSFFFDGVPVDADTLSNRRNQTTEIKAAKRRKIRADSISAANRFYIHSPYAEGECESCHNMKTEAKNGSSLPSLSADPAVGKGWLIIPVEELCIVCHEEMSTDYAEENELSIHAPVAEGMCITCHNPHRSRNEHLLKTKTARELCLECHEISVAESEDGHPELEEDDDCTMCHNPHLSPDELFLE